jgi:hypothetical protein
VLLYMKYRSPVETVVIYTGGTRRAEEEIEAGSLRYRVKAVFMSRFDGEAVLARVEGKVAAGERLDRRDFSELVFVPCMRLERSAGEALLRAVELARWFSDEEERMMCVGAAVTLGEKFLDAQQTARLEEVLSVSKVLDRMGERYREQGYAEGEAKGEAKARADAVLELLRRLGPVPADLERRVRAQETEVLRKLLLAAVEAREVAEFTARLDQLAGR